jgi:hypothetical protein
MREEIANEASEGILFRKHEKLQNKKEPPLRIKNNKNRFLYGPAKPLLTIALQ